MRSLGARAIIVALLLLLIPIGRPVLASTFVEYPVPTASSVPTGIAPGPDGNLWFVEHSGNNVGKITTTGAVTEYPVPTASATPLGISAGPDGNLWFTEDGAARIGKITPSGVITEYPIPGVTPVPLGITSGPDGNLWFTDDRFISSIGKITTGGAVTEYAIPTEPSVPTGITAGPDGNLWFTESSRSIIGKVTIGGVFTEYLVPTISSDPEAITNGPDGNLWFTEQFGNNIGKITPSGVFTEYPVPIALSHPFGITAGPDGNIWFTAGTGNIGSITTSGVVTEYTIPTALTTPYDITAGPDGNLWFTQAASNEIGVLELQAPVKVAKFFTDSSLNPLPVDSIGNPMVNVIVAGGTVKSTNPGQILAWVNVTDLGSNSLQSLRLNDTLPVDWSVDPLWMPGLGGISIYYANTSSLATNPDITQPSSITVSTGNPQTVQLSIPSFNTTGIGHPLLPGQSILLSVKLTYGLKMTSQSAATYPRNYTDTATAAAWSQASYTGTEASATGSAFFTAYAKIVSNPRKLAPV